jgi:hypothetical protein
MLTGTDKAVRRRLIWPVILAVVMFFVCPMAEAAPTHDIIQFSNRYPIILGIDLRDDARPRAALAVNAGVLPSAGDPNVNVQLPFSISGEESNERAAFRVGKYQSWTLISYWAGGSNWPQYLRFDPTIDRISSTDDADSQVSSIHLVAEGQLRRFSYRYVDVTRDGRLRGDLGEMNIVTPDAINILLPDHARAVAVADGQLEVPARLDPNQRLFPGSGDRAKVSELKIAYEVPPTDFQKLVVTWGVKFLAAILPIIGLFIVTPEQIARPTFKFAVIGVGSSMAATLLGLILWTAYKSGNWADSIPDLFLLLMSSSLSVTSFVMKRRDSGSLTS